MGKRSDFPRRKNDAYLTWDKRALPPLLRYINGPHNRFVEPCAGAGHLVDQLEAAGHRCVQAYDIAPQRYDIEVGDVLASYGRLPASADRWITNPPWTRPILHAIIEILGARAETWLLFDSDWAFTKQAAPYLERYCHRIVPIGRLRWEEGTTDDAKDNCAWYHFGPGAPGRPIIEPRY
jgi:hypothetical protein